MYRRIPGALAALALLGAVVTPALAQSRILVQKDSFKGQAGVFLSHGLIPGHRFRVTVTAVRRANVRSYGKVAGIGTEFYTYTTTKGLFTGNASVKFNGRVPYHTTITPPRSGLASWALAVNIGVVGAQSVRVQYIDLGKR